MAPLKVPSSFLLPLHCQGNEATGLSTVPASIGRALDLPALVVGFFGANTWLPGDQHRPAGDELAFVIMISAIAILSVCGFTVIWRFHREERREAQELKEEQAASAGGDD